MWRWPLGRVIMSVVGVLALALICLSGGSIEGVVGLLTIIGGGLLIYAAIRMLR